MLIELPISIMVISGAFLNEQDTDAIEDITLIL